MAENHLPDVQLEANSNGKVYFASDVVATIAGLAVTEVEGVANTVGVNNGLADIFSRRAPGNTRNLTRGIKVEIVDNAVAVDVTIIVEYASPVPEVAGAIQENVKKAIETMTGMNVSKVDVHVQGVSFERENRAAAELEMKQRKLLEKKTADEADAARIAEETAKEKETEVPVAAPMPDTVPPASDEPNENPTEQSTEEPGDEFHWVLEDVEPETETADAPESDLADAAAQENAEDAAAAKGEN